MFKFYEDAVKFVGVLALLATVGMIYSTAVLIVKNVSVLPASLFTFHSVNKYSESASFSSIHGSS